MSIVGSETVFFARACTGPAESEQIYIGQVKFHFFLITHLSVTHAGCTTSSQNICVQSRTGLVPSGPISASESANCQSTSLSMSPSSRSSRTLRCVLSSSSSEDGCTLRLFCACDGTGMGRTGTEGHSPGRESLRRWRSICMFTLQRLESESVQGYAREERALWDFLTPASQFQITSVSYRLERDSVRVPWTVLLGTMHDVLIQRA